jgi:anhydro-N-acetylmuramic acid kinase
MSAVKTVLGLMSGTSLDGIDMAMLQTDGAGHIKLLRDGFAPYQDETRALLRALLDAAVEWPTQRMNNRADWPKELIAAEQAVTQAHSEAVEIFLGEETVALIGFHGQTVSHRPDEGFTLQIGDGQALADAAQCDVVGQFRLADMAAGGQGAPLAPLFHAAMAGQENPLAVLNLGGVGNLTWLGADDAMLAFDTGPANALLDDWVAQKTGASYDKDGALALRGTVNEAALAALMAHDYFDATPPKSLDRLSFDSAPVAALSDEDGAATLTAFTAQAVARGLAHCPDPPRRMIVCGGGRHNKTLCAMLAERCATEIVDCDKLGWRGDSLEAQAFAWLAMRSLAGLPLSRPETTAARYPVSGGVLYKA